MATPAAKVLEQALALTPEERIELAQELLASVAPAESPDWAAAWKAELADRWAAHEAGVDAGVPFDDAIEQIRAEIRASRS